MSIKQIQKVFTDTNLKGNEKLLMLALADNCNDNGVSFPSWNSLMIKTSMSKGSISKWFNELEKKGLLFRVSRNRKNGSRTSNKYLIYPYDNKKLLDDEELEAFSDNFNQSSEVELVQELNIPCSEVELPKGGQSSEVEHLEPSLTFNHHFNHHSLCVAEQKEELFNQFWTVYPKKVSKQTAKKAFMKKDNFDYMPDIQEVIQKINLLSVTDKWTKDKGQYIPNPATWLNAHGWEDEVELSDYDKAKAIAKANGMSMTELYQQMNGGAK